MTVKELSELHYLDGMIKHETERLEELRDAADVKAQVITGMPTAHGAHDRIGEVIPRIVDMQREIEENIKSYRERRERILKFIHSAPQVRLRLIMALRFIDQRSWQEVADEIGGKETEYSVKQACYRYVEGKDAPPLPGQLSMFENPQ